MRVEESNQCESPISIARERSSYSKRFVKLLQDFHHFIEKFDFLGLNTKVSFFPTWQGGTPLSSSMGEEDFKLYYKRIYFVI